MTDFLEQTRNEIGKRLAELRPLLDEYGRLQVAADALGNIAAPAVGRAAPTRPGRRTKRRSTSRRTATARATAPRTSPPGRRKGSGKRAVQAIAAITDQPGIRVPELASKMGIKPTYLYRLLPELQKEGKIIKQGRGWHPKEA